MNIGIIISICIPHMFMHFYMYLNIGFIDSICIPRMFIHYFDMSIGFIVRFAFLACSFITLLWTLVLSLDLHSMHIHLTPFLQVLVEFVHPRVHYSYLVLLVLPRSCRHCRFGCVSTRTPLVLMFWAILTGLLLLHDCST